MRKAVASKIVNEVANWGHAGHIDAALLKTLNERYNSDMTMGRVLLRWLGFAALFMLAMSVFGSIGLLLGSAVLFLGPLVLGAMAVAAWRFGVRMATDPTQRFATSGAVLVTFSLILCFAALLTLYAAFGGENWSMITPFLMVVVGIAALGTAYRHRLRWPLLLGVLFLFHALGSQHGYWGRGAYFFGVKDEWLMLGFATAVVALGLWHEKSYEADTEHDHLGFGHVYIIIGLLYANMSLWILSIQGRELALTLLFAAASIAQIVIGARLHDSRLTGFGIVFLAINIYTRMFEGFWDTLSKGTFFLLAGLLAVVAGIAFEARARKLRDAS